MIEERKQILQMVKDGKISVEEAMSLLEELEQSTHSMKLKEKQMLNELSNVVHFQDKKNENNSYNHQSAKEKFFDFVDSALKKLKDFDFDFNFAQYIEVPHIFQQGNILLNEIQVDIANGKVSIIPWDQKDVRIECVGKVYRVHTIEEARQRFVRDVLFEIKGDTLQFSTKQKWMKLEVKMFVPKLEYQRIKIRMFNGSIDSKDLNVNEFKLKTANGGIFLSRIKSREMEAETINGKVSIINSQCNHLELGTINGAVTVDGDFQHIYLQSFNGNMACNIRGMQCDYIDIRGGTGSIDISIPKDMFTVMGELKTNLGGVQVELEGIQIIEEKSEVIQKMLEFKTIKHLDKKLNIKANTKTGSITVISNN